MVIRSSMPKSTAKETKITKAKNIKVKNPKHVKANMEDIIEKPRKKKPMPSIENFGNKSPAAPVKSNSAIAPRYAENPILSDDALPGLIGKIVKIVCKHCESDKSAVLMAVLLRWAALFSGHFIHDGEVQQWARTFAVIVGNSPKSRITASAKTVDRLFDGSRTSYRCFSGPLSEVDDIIYKVRDATDEYNHAGKYVGIDRGESNKNLYVLDKNFAFSLASKKPVLDTMSSVITGLFDDGDAVIQLSKDKWLKTTGADVTILAHIQRAELDAMRDKLNMPNGFASCFLWVLADRHSCIPLPEQIPAEQVEYFRKLIDERVEKANKFLCPITMTAQAKKLWEKAYPGLTTKYSGFAGSVVDRNDVHARRLAVIYALASGHSQIQTKDLKAAIAVVNYSCESALLLFSGANQDKRQEKILQALRSAPNQELASTEITKVFGNNISGNEKDEILRELVAAKLIVMEKVESKTKGKKTTMVRLATAENQQS